ncbi:MAG: hypothetical protein J0M02_15870 [Planctomycetes bacterium]|nr:hypothetical protein [Planctomycetota bacterium]
MTAIVPSILRSAAALGLACSALFAADGPSTVQLVQKDGSWQLLRDGKPFVVRGAGGDASKALLASIGGNTCRTWGADDIQDRLDDAHKNGLAVVVGIWLGHERHGFKWNDPVAVKKQFEMAKEQVLKWKDHPAVLAWGLGNEMEGYAAGDNVDIWKGIQDIAAMVKQIDPKHPTLTTVAEVGGKRVELIHSICKDIDIVGINTYAGCASMPERYRKAGGTKPYMITEYGPAGTWEIGKNPLGAVDEPTSTEKAKSYKGAYDALAADTKLCLGSIAFAWGSKVEATATWYGMVLPDDSKLEVVDMYAAAWGRPVKNRCPQIQAIAFDAGKYPTLKPGQIVKATSVVTDPEGDAMNAEWIIAQELSDYNTGGDAIAMPPTFPEDILKPAVGSCEFKVPEGGGVYRIYTYVRDGKGGAALASAVFKVDGPKVPPKPQKPKLPAPVAGGEGEPLWAASGYMGDTGSIQMQAASSENPKVGKSCMKVTFDKGNGWGGVVWQSPANDWGNAPGGFNLTGAKKLSFWARGAAGGEKVKFGFGIIGNDKPFGDTAKVEREVVMTSEWQQIDIDVAGRDLSRIKTGFMWVVGGQGKPVTFYLDDVRWE